MTETTALIAFPKLNLPNVTGITEQMNTTFKTMFTRIEDDIAHLPTDMTDPKNRAAVASYAYKISRTKTGLDEAAAGVSSEAKAIVDAVNTERRNLKNTLDILRDKARAALTAWEEAEKAKTERAEAAIAGLTKALTGQEESGELAMLLNNLGDWDITAELYGEAVERVDQAHKDCVDRVANALDAREKYEAEQAELEQLRREKAEREEADRIRREQEEAERAARMAEEKRLIDAENERIRQEEERARIAQEAEEKAKREAAEAIEKEKREREAAEQRAKEAEEREAKRAEDEKRREIEAEEQRKEAAARAEEEAQRREAAAKEQERQRIAAEALAKERADQERAADLAHRKKINSAVVAAMVTVVNSHDFSEAEAQSIVMAIYRGQIPHISIAY